MGGNRPKTLSARYGWFALAILFVVALFNYVDRSILSIMQVALKRDLGLTDTELGSLTGLSFAIFYTTGALPVAWLADRIARKYVLTAALAIWTLMTAASSLATGFVSLSACRIGVAVGEAGCVPASHSLISDYFPRQKRALAMAVWGLSMPLGGMLGVYLGGQLTAAIGWRGAFAAIGLGGLVLAPLVALFLKEPQRGRFDGASGVKGRSVWASLAILWRFRSFRYLCLAEGLQAWGQTAMQAWNAPFYSRLHHMPLAHIAAALSLIIGLSGAAGTFLGGALANSLARRDVRWFMRIPAIAAVLTAPFALLQYLTPSLTLSLAAAIVPAAMVNVYMAPANAMSQSLVPADMRAFTSAMLVLVVNVIGLGLGPVSIGALSDVLAHHYGLGAASLRWALPTVAIPATVSALLFLLSSLYLPRELSPLHRAEAEPANERPQPIATGSSHPRAAASRP
ncbi:spinster family MFS transporter [Phenylobacterium montanum]|uniref:MFS transporter n=1 Tax=Phenylobacterium montanum TaxID=2823693 RepID=A0A975IX00_9CAUL|nr:MFS transporter [Caulobacter sp. S6]QUD90375.1 MFS transporter [Caulobacter sp. S6]